VSGQDSALWSWGIDSKAEQRRAERLTAQKLAAGHGPAAQGAGIASRCVPVIDSLSGSGAEKASVRGTAASARSARVPGRMAIRGAIMQKVSRQNKSAASRHDLRGCRLANTEDKACRRQRRV